TFAKCSQTVDMQHQISMTVVEPGEDFNLTCSITGLKAGLFYWFKLKFGYMVQTVAAGNFGNVKVGEQFKNSRHTVTVKENLYFLNIRNVSKEDEATYFCQAGTAYEMKVINSTLLAVNDHKNHQNLVYVKQRPEAQSVQAGGSVKLQCSLLSKSKENREQCPGEHSVYWFRAAAGEAHPAVIYTQSHRSEEEEKRSCVYNLSKTIHNSSDAGTYYCAVLTCGQILFVIMHVLLCCLQELKQFHIIDFMILAQTSQSQNDLLQDADEAALNYVALDFAARKAKRWTAAREQSLDCTYSGVGESL
uniref:Ig-like domain-containing protein n=1 Tax=Labrus bergylta TaxID=56723 RepID=A0A3Q3EPW2_9LABR